jgi:hypothetical protein
MYDPALGRFTSADTIIPPGLQGLDRYAYVNNAPVMYVDPSGHFTETAIYNYLYGQCLGGGDKNDDKVNARAEKCANSTMQTWQADEEWWNMISVAEEGDVLFGSFGGGNTVFSVTFTGSGNESLTGIDTSDIANDLSESYADDLKSVNLIDIQDGQKSTRRSDGGGSNLWLFNWAGFYRTGEDGKPSFYVRPGKEFQQVQWDPRASRWVDAAAGLGIGGLSGRPVWALITFIAGGALPSVSDVLNMESTDRNVQIGPVQFNFQLQTDTLKWILEAGPSFNP